MFSSVALPTRNTRGTGSSADINDVIKNPLTEKIVDQLDLSHSSLRIGWATRAISTDMNSRLSDWSIDSVTVGVEAGDLILAKVRSLSSHRALITSDSKRLRLYRDDYILGVAGNRYASDAFEARITSDGPLHLLTASGMCGTVVSRHSSQAEPTTLELVGRVCDSDGRINLIERCFSVRVPAPGKPNVVLVLGSGMNAGKTTTSRRLVKSLLRNGLRVSACKLTGSVSHRDLYEYESTGAQDVRDFSSYGFPSTFGCPLPELERLFLTMVADAELAKPDVIVMEIADGLLQKETAAILGSAICRSRVVGAVLAAPCSLSSLQGIHQLTKHGHRVLAVSGLISNSPLMVREFSALSSVPFASSSSQARELSACVIAALEI